MGAFDDLIPADKARAAVKGAGPSGAFDDLIPGRSVGQELARQGGLTARYLVEGLTGIANIFADPIVATGNLAKMASNSVLGTDFAMSKHPSQAVSDVLTDVGLPNPETAGERIVGGGSRALASAGGTVALARAAATEGPALLKEAIAARPTGKVTAQPVADALAAGPGMQAAASTVSGTAGAATREAGGGPLAELAVALATGVMTPGAIEALRAIGPAGMRALSQVAKPFSQAGREEIAANTLNRLATDPKAALATMEAGGATEFVPGSLPTTAQASRDLGLLQAERTLAAEGSQFAQRRSANATARDQFLSDIAGDPQQVKRLEAQREADANVNYDAARRDVPTMTPEIEDVLSDLKSRPAFRDAVREAVKNLANEGIEVPRVREAAPAAPAATRSRAVEPTKDDVIVAIRKLGGIDPADEAVGSLARANPFPNDPQLGPVWRRAGYANSAASGTRTGHSLDRMAQMLADYGYPVNGPDDVMNAIADATLTGQPMRSTYFDHAAEARAQDPLASSIDRLVEKLDAKGKAPEAPVDFQGGGVRLLHATKMELDKAIQKAQAHGNANDVRVLTGVQERLLQVLDNPDFSPHYRGARDTYAAQTRPIEQLQTLQDIQGRTAVASPDVSGAAVLSQAKWTNAVTKRLDELGSVLSPEQSARLRLIGEDLDRASLSDTAGKAVGSNTFQNLSTANVLGAALGGKAATNAVGQTLLRPLQWLYRLPEPQVRDLVVQAMLDPSVAKALMSKATPQNVEFLADALRFNARAIGLGATVGAAVSAEQ